MKKTLFGWPQALGVVIIVGLLVAGTYTAIQISPRLPNAFNGLAAAIVSVTQRFIGGERLILTVTPESLNSGEETTLSWTHRNKTGNGTYTLSYPCIEGTYLGVQVSSGTKKMLCDTPSEIVSADSNLTLFPVSEKEGLIEIPITFSYAASKDTQNPIITSVTLSVTGKIKTSIEKIDSEEEKVVETPVVPVSKTETSPAPSKIQTPGTPTEKTYTLSPVATNPTPKPASYGKTDLAPRIIAIGTINRTTNQFSTTTSLLASDRIAVKFEVENLGTADSGAWYFSAVLPTYPMYIFQSESQQNLSPGDRIEFTLGFDQVEPDKDGQFLVNIDPNGSLSEASELNNMATTSIRASSK